MIKIRNLLITTALLFAGSIASAEDHALLIGIRSYDPDQLTAVPSAEKDAERFADLFRRIGYSENQITLMTNSAGATKPQHLPTRSNLLKQLTQVTDHLEKDDSLTLVFGGHGIQGQDGKYYLCPFDADLSEIDSLIQIDEVFARFDACRSTKKLMLIEAMHQRPFPFAADPALAKSFVPRMPSLPPLPNNTAIFVGCSHGQSSLGVARNGSSQFFDAIIRGVQGDAAGSDGSVTLPDVERFLKKQFANASAQPELHNNVAGLITIATHSLGASDLEKIQKLIRGDRYAEAAKIVDARLETHPNDGIALAQRARLLCYEAEQLRRYTEIDRAHEIAERAVKLAPNEAMPYIARANVFRIQKKYEKSFADGSMALRLDPNCVMAHVIRGFAMHHLHNLEGMGREARLGMEMDPENPEARATYVAYLFAKGKLGEGHAQLDRAIAITPDMPALYFLKGYGYEKQARHQLAVEQYSKAIKLNDQIPSYLCRRA
ncbi:MAG: caspase family protein, partial [Planctomycetota bacterium]